MTIKLPLFKALPFPIYIMKTMPYLRAEMCESCNTVHKPGPHQPPPLILSGGTHPAFAFPLARVQLGAPLLRDL